MLFDINFRLASCIILAIICITLIILYKLFDNKKYLLFIIAPFLVLSIILTSRRITVLNGSEVTTCKIDFVLFTDEVTISGNKYKIPSDSEHEPIINNTDNNAYIEKRNYYMYGMKGDEIDDSNSKYIVITPHTIYIPKVTFSIKSLPNSLSSNSPGLSLYHLWW
jgi:hypothetical protein